MLPAWRWVIAYTVAELAVPWFLLSSAETRLTSSLSGLLVAAVPLIGALLAWATRSEHQLDGRRLAGLGVGVVGVGVLLGFDVTAHDLGAVAEVGLCAIGYAVGPMIISRKLSRLPSIGVVAASLTLSAVVYAPLGIAQLAGGHPTPRALASAATLGVVCTAVAFVLFFALIAEIGPVRSTVITYFNPAVALVLGVTILGEPLRIGTVLGFALILVGSVLATRQRRRRPHRRWRPATRNQRHRASAPEPTPGGARGAPPVARTHPSRDRQRCRYPGPASGTPPMIALPCLDVCCSAACWWCARGSRHSPWRTCFHRRPTVWPTTGGSSMQPPR